MIVCVTILRYLDYKYNNLLFCFAISFSFLLIVRVWAAIITAKASQLRIESGRLSCGAKTLFQRFYLLNGKACNLSNLINVIALGKHIPGILCFTFFYALF